MGSGDGPKLIGQLPHWTSVEMLAGGLSRAAATPARRTLLKRHGETMARGNFHARSECADRRRSTKSRQRGRSRFWSGFERLEQRLALAFGLTTTSSTYTVDTGANLVFTVARTKPSGGAVGDLMSMKYNGTDLEAPFSATSRYSHYESGLSSNTVVTATVDPQGNWIMIACDDTGPSGVGVIQYYIARKGFNNIYLATYAPTAVGEMRFITYTNHSILVNAPAPSNLTGNTGAIESSDVVGFADGTTASKYYGEYSAIDAQNYGLTGGGFGVFMDIGNRETDSGGPFFKDIDFQTTSSQSTELYNYMFSSHSQTEFSDSAQSQSSRTGLFGPYALEFTTGGAPAPVDYSFIAGLNLQGYVGAAGRGTLSGTASGVPSGHQVTVALSNGVGQYWATPDPVTGAYTVSGIKPGIYTETLYQDELAVGTQAVTISAGGSASANIADTLFAPPEVFLIGSWDGTPNGFLNSDLFPNMHPSDSRMNPWGTFTDATDTTAMTNYVVGTSPTSAWPMAEWKEATTDPTKPIDNINRITFTLTAAQVVASTLRIGITRAGSGARPIISVNGGSFSSVPASSPQASGRGVTLGNSRGNNITYNYSISASALHVGTNTIDIEVASGSSSASPWLGPWIIYDAIDLVPTANMTNAPKATSVSIVPSNLTVPLNGQQSFVAIAKDQFGNPIPEFPMAFTWSTTLGTINSNGLYTAGAAFGSGTVSVSFFDTTTNSTKTATVAVTNNNAPTVTSAAAATPNPVTGVSTNLSVLGADDGGEANLSYTWAATGNPPAGVSFSANGTNAAKNTVATFAALGNYTLTVTIRDSGNLTATSTVNVVVNQSLTSISVSPTSATVVNNNLQQFAATGLDQFGNPLATQPSFAWSLDSGSVGSVDSTGLYTSPISTIGAATVRATSGAVSGAAPVNVVWLKGDLNGDGQLTASDVAAMMTALVDLNGYQTQRGLSNADLLTIADVNNDGAIDNRDMQAIISLLANASMVAAGGGGSMESLASSSQSSTPSTVSAPIMDSAESVASPAVESTSSETSSLLLPINQVAVTVEPTTATLNKTADFIAEPNRTNSSAVDHYFIDFGRFADHLAASRGKARHLIGTSAKSSGDSSELSCDAID